MVVKPVARSDGNQRPSGSGARRSGLGRGLGALIPVDAGEGRGAALTIDLNAIEPNPFQPRAEMDPDQLETLTASIRSHGIVQPLIVATGAERDRYVLIAGERRWRAARQAGLTSVPVIVRDATPQAMLELALIENVVRADLSPLEEGAAYRQLVEDFGLTQGEVAERVGRSRASIANTMRLLAAPDQIKIALVSTQISEGHARALLGLPAALDQIAALEIVLERDLNVRQTEALVRRWDTQPTEPSATSSGETQHLENRFRAALGQHVRVVRNARGGGSVTIQYHSGEELDALYQRIVGEEDW